ncbi:MAG: hypothetical protein EZS28_009214 [Streblomastix strix]|uniref:Uncharacterized protein n=1 Tax=Streblomastix strix TaxID=222440 RepID=A0A5J4WLW4_9EUKA|nr:MAG: hypothetical protein EZS28_009214 [Streblomastix strix]
MPIFEPLTANITIAIDALESLNIDWKSIWKAIWEAAIKYACESNICDGETGFKANIIRLFCENNKISLYFTGSPLTQHNRVVDCVMRTIRYGFGKICQDLQHQTRCNKWQRLTIELHILQL